MIWKSQIKDACELATETWGPPRNWDGISNFMFFWIPKYYSEVLFLVSGFRLQIRAL